MNHQSQHNFGLITLWTPEIHAWCEPYWKEKQRYCDRFGIATYGYSDRLDPSREPTWSKIIAIQDKLPLHDWVFWLDADATITNFDFDIGQLADDDYDLIITHDHGGFNAGAFLIKNSETSFEFLERVWARNIRHFHFEQTAMVEIMAEMPELRVKILPKRSMNSYWFDHRPGDFIFHAAGEDQTIKTKLLTVFKNAALGKIEDPAAAPTERSKEPGPVASQSAHHVAESAHSSRIQPLASGRRQKKCKRAVITTCTVFEDSRYLELSLLWAEGVRRSGWTGDIVIFTNAVLDFADSEVRKIWNVKIEAMAEPSSKGDAYRQKVAAALAALDVYDEILFTDVDVVVNRDPSSWAFSHERMMVSQDVFNLFHPCMLNLWYPEVPDSGEPGANTGIWSLSRKHVPGSLWPWYLEMAWRIETSRWPYKTTLHDQPQLNKLWYEGRADIGLFPADRISYPGTPDWPGNHPDCWAFHCCGVASARDEMRRILRTINEPPRNP